MVVSTSKTCGDTGGRWGGEGGRVRLLLHPLLQKVRGGLAVRLRLDGSLCTVVRVVVEVLTVGQRPLSGHLVEGPDRAVRIVVAALTVGQRSWFGHLVESGSLCLRRYRGHCTCSRRRVELEKRSAGGSNSVRPHLELRAVVPRQARGVGYVAAMSRASGEVE